MFRKMLAYALPAVRRPHLRLVSSREKERERYFDIHEVRAPGTESHNSVVAGFISDQRRIIHYFHERESIIAAFSIRLCRLTREKI